MPRLKDIFDPKRWRAYYIHLLRKELKKRDQADWTPEVYEVEQYMYRYIRCAPCLKKGKCVHCECKIPERMHVRTDECSNGKWEAFMDEESWNTFKEVNGLIFKIAYE